MLAEGWFRSSLALPRLHPSTVSDLIDRVATAMSTAVDLEASTIAATFREAMQSESFSVGSGVAIPHTQSTALTETVVCLVTLAKPLPLTAIDGKPPDVFWFVLSKPDPAAHLHLLAHLARITQSRTFLEGLRAAKTAEEMVTLVQAAELRHSLVPTATASTTSATGALIVISASGEKMVDALLIDLVDRGFSHASVLEAQSLREAAAREVPLFAGFRDLFGDPGGRRVILIESTADRANSVVEAVKRLAEEYRAKDARVSIIPIQTTWTLSQAPAESDAP